MDNNIIRIKRRLSGSPGAPSSLKNAELAYNEVEDALYYGKGVGGGGGSATAIQAIGGPGVMVTRFTDQTISGLKTFESSISMDGHKITHVGAPEHDDDAANKGYVDAVKAGLDPKDSVVVATTDEKTLSGEQTIDGVNVVTGDRVLVKNQSNPAENGIYVVSTGTWSRSIDANSTETITPGMFTFVEEGTKNANSGWVLTTNNVITVDITGLTFVKFSALGMITAGAGLTKSGDTLNIIADSNRIVVNPDSIDLAQTGITPGIYKSVTVDEYGRITAGTNPTTLAGYGITDAQPLDDTLTALAETIVDQDELIYATGHDEFATTPLTPYARTLISNDNSTDARDTLELGNMAIQNADNINITGGTLSNVYIDGGTF